VDWSQGPEALIRQFLVCGNLLAAVECCFKSGRYAEALLLATSGSPELWAAARDEYLRLKGDPFLMTVGDIMMTKFENLVNSADLSNWMETLAILATYSGNQYQPLCEQLAQRLEKEKFDICAAVVCYMCARNFQKTINIWVQTPVAVQGSHELGLQDLVEKMAVFQKAINFRKADPVFNAKVTKYADLLANSGRLTAAMRYLCLLQDDNDSLILRDRIFNSDPKQMGMTFGSAPPFPFDRIDVRAPHQSSHAGVVPKVATSTVQAKAPVRTGSSGALTTNTSSFLPTPPAQHMPAQPQVPSMHTMDTVKDHTHPASNPNNRNMPPLARTGVPSSSSFGVNNTMGVSNVMPTPGIMHSTTAPPPPPMRSTAPVSSAMPTVPDMPVSWPLPTSTQSKLSTTTSVAKANEEVQKRSAGGENFGQPMEPNDFARVQAALDMILEVSAQDGNIRKRDDNTKRLGDLYSKLRSGQVKDATQQKIMQLVAAIEGRNYTVAQKVLQQELCMNDWDQNKFWLQGLRRMLPTQ